ncbi:hypothetical protein C8J57DRAFT_1484994 [Mycena rebaudengoi]|nr:hypothetical protein C8J57DRAFT_1484994 [Mycena rebaudengoi]
MRRGSHVADIAGEMGQYWKLINLDKQKTFGGWGKLGEFLFDHPYADSLETAMRGSKLPDLAVVFPPFDPGALYQAALYSYPALYFSLKAPRSITCQVLYDIGREHMYRHIVQIMAGYSWAGDRIIYAGDYLQNDDIPVGILTAAENKALQPPAQYDDDDDDDDDDNDDDDERRSLYSLPYTQMDRLPITMRNFWTFHCPFHTKSRDVIDGYVLESLYRRQPTTPAPTEPAFLRNLSRKKYVRELALRDLKTKYSGTRVLMADVSLAEVAIIRICLSSDPSIATPYEGDLHRDVWAGDRFDIVEGNEWLGNEEGGWVDASKEVLKELEDI